MRAKSGLIFATGASGTHRRSPRRASFHKRGEFPPAARSLRQIGLMLRNNRRTRPARKSPRDGFAKAAQAPAHMLDDGSRGQKLHSGTAWQAGRRPRFGSSPVWSTLPRRENCVRHSGARWRLNLSSLPGRSSRRSGRMVSGPVPDAPPRSLPPAHPMGMRVAASQLESEAALRIEPCAQALSLAGAEGCLSKKASQASATCFTEASSRSRCVTQRSVP